MKFCFTLIIAAAVVQLAHAAFIFDTDGSAEDLLTLVTILEEKPQSDRDRETGISLVIVSANGRGVTSASTAMKNVKAILQLAKRDDIPVVLGDQLSWSDRQAAYKDTEEAPTCEDHLHYPKTPFDVVHVHPPTIVAPWSQFDEDTLFGLSPQLPWQPVTLNSKTDPSGSITGSSLASRSSHTAAVEAISEAMDRLTKYDRMNYIALGPLTNVANWLKMTERTISDSNSVEAQKLKRMQSLRGNLNVIMVPKVDFDGLRLDPLATDYILTFLPADVSTRIMRKLLTTGFTSGVETWTNSQWTIFEKFTQKDKLPVAVQIAAKALLKKKERFDAYQAQKRTFIDWIGAPYGPQSTLAVLVNWRTELMAGESVPDSRALRYKSGNVKPEEYAPEAKDEASGSSSIDSVPSKDEEATTLVYEKPFAHSDRFYYLWLSELEKKWFMEG